ncbi:MAG: hypothetical protein AAF236_02010 [Verrucomicrobiota bacterium]
MSSEQLQKHFRILLLLGSLLVVSCNEPLSIEIYRANDDFEAGHVLREDDYSREILEIQNESSISDKKMIDLTIGQDTLRNLPEDITGSVLRTLVIKGELFKNLHFDRR